MRAVFVVLKRNMRKRILFSAVILIMSAITTMILSTTLGAIEKNSQIYDDSYIGTSSPDLVLSFSESNYDNTYEDFFLNNNNVSDVKVLKSYMGVLKKENAENIIFFSQYNDQSKLNYDSEKEFHEGDIFLPLYMESAFELSIGDSVTVDIGSDSKSFNIIGFYEDPVFGSPIMRYKQGIISKKDYKWFEDNESKINPQKNFFLYVNYNLDGNNFKVVNDSVLKDFGKASLAEFSYDKDFVKKAYVMIPTILTLILCLATLFLIIISLFILRHAILTAIDADFVNIGIMKSMGFTKSQIKKIFSFQYILISALGAILGFIASFFTIPLLTQIYLNSNGIFYSGNISAIIPILVTIGIIMFVAVNVMIVVNKTKKISPVQAITIGKLPEKTSHKMDISLKSRNNFTLNLKMAFKQILKKKRQYISLLIVCLFFSFLLLSTLNLMKSFSNEDELVKLLGMPKSDIVLSINNPLAAKEKDVIDVKNQIEKKYHVSYFSSFEQTSIMADSENIVVLVYEHFNPNMNAELSSGRLPENKNEVLLTSSVIKLLNKQVGDNLVLSVEENKETFIIVGTYQSVNNVGLNMQMLRSGYESLKPDYSPLRYVVNFNSSLSNEQLDNIINEHKDINESVFINNGSQNIKSLVGTIKQGLILANLVIAMLSILICLIIVLFIGLITLRRESVDFGILKVIGFTSRQLRFQFVLRFVIVVTFGCLVGELLSNFLSESLFSTLLSMAGLTKLHIPMYAPNVILVLLFMNVVSIVVGLLTSLRMKRIRSRELIQE
ncbi:MAG: FtsX-like permease family protein [Oscillospiraceae bacterium]|jgi:putative ABC transport system permease protein|nr:FtsX-like permease family protein [Oscillospiraceae bacterium]